MCEAGPAHAQEEEEGAGLRETVVAARALKLKQLGSVCLAHGPLAFPVSSFGVQAKELVVRSSVLLCAQPVHGHVPRTSNSEPEVCVDRVGP